MDVIHSLRSVWGWAVRRAQTRGLTRLDDAAFLKAYAQFADRRVRTDPKAAVGGFWDEIGQLQLDFLRNQGLEPQHRLLDVGCGTLRAGRHFIGYLAPGNYTGFDMSGEAIREAWTLVEREGLEARNPTLIHTPSGALDFEAVRGKFDFVLAQSVFTHLRASHIEECFAHLGRVLAPRAGFYFTIFDEPRNDPLCFSYPVSFFAGLAERNGLTLAEHPEYDARHPRKQKMLSARAA